MFSLQNVINAQYLLGEHAQELQTIVVHPRVAADLEARRVMLTFSIAAAPSTWNASNGIGVSNTQIGYIQRSSGRCGLSSPGD